MWVVTPELHRAGGTERSLVEQLDDLTDSFDVRVYTMEEDAPTDRGSARHVPRTPGPHLVRFLWWMLSNTALRRLDAARRGSPDAVLSPGINCFDADIVGVHIVFEKYWTAVRRRIGDQVGPLRRVHRLLFVGLLRRLEHRIYRKGPALLWAMSTRDARELEERFSRPPGSVSVISHGVDRHIFSPDVRIARRRGARERLGVGEEERVVLVIANDEVKKGVDTAIAALSELPDDVTLAVAGRVDQKRLDTWARSIGVQSRVRCWAHAEDVLDYYAAADLLVAPSREDSFNMPVLEGLACGLPVVVSWVAGVSELLEDGRNALVLHDPEKSDVLAVLITKILDDSDLAARLGASGRALAERNPWDESARRVSGLLEYEISTPRALVLATDPGATGGIQRATRVLLRSLADLYGADRVGMLSVWRATEAQVLGRVLNRAPVRASSGEHVGTLRRAGYAISSMAAARRWKRRLVVIAAHPHLAPVALLCRTVSGAPYAVWCHGIEVWGPMRSVVALALRKADAVFAPSGFTAERVEHAANLPRGSVKVISHCVPPEATQHAVSEATRRPDLVMTVGRLSPDHAYKGIDTLIRVWPRIKANRPSASLWVIGDGPDRNRLERESASLGLDGAVRFLGRLSDEELMDAYLRASLFAMPARHRLGPHPEGEGFGLVFIEAGAAGLPVIGGRGAGVEDAVIDGVNGLLVDPWDDDEIAGAVLRILEDGKLRERLSLGGRELAASRFSYGRFREEIDELMRGLVPHIRQG